MTETLTVFLPRMHDRDFPVDLVSPVSLVATDSADVWTLTPRAGQPPAVEGPLVDGPAVADRLEGPAAALLLLLWERADAGVRRVGDPEVLERFLASRLTA